jgi:hypothetical protein
MEFSYMQQVESLFDEISNEVINRLRNDETYMGLVRRRIEVQVQFPFIRSVFEGDEAVFPTADERLAWLEVKRTLDETEQMERLALYVQGHTDCFAYLRKIGVL